MHGAREVFLAGALLVSISEGMPAGPETKAVEVAEQVYTALGGPALARAGYLGFTFAVLRSGEEVTSFRHAWDRRAGRYRVEGETSEGRVLVVFDLDSKEGRVWREGQELHGEEASKWLEFGYGRYINDTYWLLVPFKLQDPGVKLHYQGAQQEGGNEFDLIGLSFDNVGLTPGDRYTLWIDRSSHRVDRWEMLLEGRQPPPVRSDWHDWVQRGGVWFSGRKTMGNSAIEFRDIVVDDEPDPTLFSAEGG